MMETVNSFFSKWMQRIKALGQMKIPTHASSASFFIALSVFPLLVLFLGLLRYTGISVDALTDAIKGLVPEALMPYAKKLILSTYRNSSGAIVSISAVTALWSAGLGMHGLLSGLNAVYEIRESRGYFYTRLLSMVYTFLFLLVLLLTLVLHVFGGSLFRVLENSSNPLLMFLAEVVDLRFFLLLFLQTSVFTALFMALPNQESHIFDALPGALLSSIGWLVFTNIYSWYVENFPMYANIYGSVYAVALSLLWLYICICIVFYGGLLNRWIIKSREDKR